MENVNCKPDDKNQKFCI